MYLIPFPFISQVLGMSAAVLAIVTAATYRAIRVLLGFGSDYYPSDYGTAGPGATAAQNTTAIQAAITAARTAKGRVVLDTPGVWLHNLTTNPYQGGTSMGFDLGSQVADLEIYLGVGVELKLADNQQSGSTNLFYQFVFQSCARIRCTGPGILNSNSQGQSGWTGGYGQQLGGHFNGYQIGGVGNVDITIEDLTLNNTFGNPVNIGASSGLANNRIWLRGLKCRVFGEGLQLIEVKNFWIINCTVDDTGNTARGDYLETSNCQEGVISGNHVIGSGTNNLAGSGLDLFGSKRVVVSGNVFKGCSDLIGFGSNGASIVDEIAVTGNVFDNCRGGPIIGEGKITFAGNHWKGVGVAAGYCIQTIGTSPTGRFQITGDTFDGCASNTHSGTNITMYNGCNFLNGTSHGVVLSRDGSGNIPTVRWYGGSINGCVGAGVATSSSGPAFSPVFFGRGVHLTGNTGGAIAHFGGGDAAAFDNVL